MVFNIRPFAEEFLNTMSRDFEIVIFTAGEQDVSKVVLVVKFELSRILLVIFNQFQNLITVFFVCV